MTEKSHVKIKKDRWILVGIILIACFLRGWGLPRDLPLIVHADELSRVSRALQVATSGDLNPHWFGHPASTVIYPLAAIYHLWNVIFYSGPLFQADPNLKAVFYDQATQTYMLGRFLSVGYSILIIPLIFQIGRKAFNQRVGLIGAWLSILSPTATLYGQMARGDDMSSTFFGLLALWLCLKLYERPSLTNQIVAGLAIGLAIGSRYFMAALAPVLLAIDGLLLRRQRSFTWPGIILGGLGIVAGFALSTPYFFLDFSTVLADFSYESRNTHLGADGLSPPGNFFWYVTEGIPLGLTWPIAIFAAVGVGLIIYRRKVPQLLLLGFVLVFLMIISLPALHWKHWVVQILPILALFAADGLTVAVEKLSALFKQNPRLKPALLALFLLLVSVWPAYQLALHGIRNSRPSTNILARNWIINNLPAGSKVAVDNVLPLAETQFVVFEAKVSLAAENYTVDQARQLGWGYVVAISDMYNTYLNNPGRYPEQVTFYETLFTKGQLLQQFEPSATRRGPTIRIYKLPRAP